jgi:hypothetical protein
MRRSVLFANVALDLGAHISCEQRNLKAFSKKVDTAMRCRSLIFTYSHRPKFCGEMRNFSQVFVELKDRNQIQTVTAA